MKRLRRTVRLGCGGLAGLIAAAAIISALINVGLPAHSAIVDRLSAAEKVRLAEATHLRSTLGDAVWPGWSRRDAVLLQRVRTGGAVGSTYARLEDARVRGRHDTGRSAARGHGTPCFRR
jgi:hypothetical protein